MIRKGFVSAALAIVLAFGVCAAAEADSITPASTLIPHAADSSLVRDLRKGGYIVFFRHGMTNWQERDAREGDFSDRAAQRNLSEPGRKQMTGVGKAIAALRLPIEKVLASPMWRCRDTAELAFGKYDTTSALFYKGPQFREARLKMLGTAPASGKNLILVGHQDQLIPIVPGLQRDALKEGDALVFQPLGDSRFRVVSQVTPQDWARLAGLPASASTAAGAPAAGSMPAVAAPGDSSTGRPR